MTMWMLIALITLVMFIYHDPTMSVCATKKYIVTSNL